ncbi:XRE family transcriptional regulator [Acinetobacter entericus]|jgi:phage repressor protein C with HTH and peptisase S24 domain|uniref:Helix-turn-helix domain-containing protein n=1 Tax=Acinetobacter entericus TaxID=2989714 RepID=A0ABT3NNR3_9GAMM|nr:S24 family peptidase [Acinetobacter entericus]MCW8041192.1 helix-turn-helix domain-containing protein [Acinetobacter entericus]
MLKDRLKVARKNARKSQLEVAEAIGITQSAYSQLETGRVDSSSHLPAIAKFLGVDSYWLQTGEGSTDTLNTLEMLDPVIATDELKDQFVWIDVVEANFSCGTGESIEFHFDAINGKIPFPPSFLKDRNVTEKTMKIIKAKGDSMADFIKDGDMVGINLAQTEVIDGEIYAVYLAGEGMIKQIFKEADGSLVLHSLNDKYRDKVVTEENGKNFKVMGRQIWRAG